MARILNPGSVNLSLTNGYNYLHVLKYLKIMWFAIQNQQLNKKYCKSQINLPRFNFNQFKGQYFIQNIKH